MGKTEEKQVPGRPAPQFSRQPATRNRLIVADARNNRHSTTLDSHDAESFLPYFFNDRTLPRNLPSFEPLARPRRARCYSVRIALPITKHERNGAVVLPRGQRGR